MFRTVLALATVSILAVACSASSEDDAADSTGEDALTMGVKPWDDQAETEWTQWISEIGEARLAKKCIHLDDCINNASINKLKKASDPNLDLFADCADVPMEMRAYFANQTGRPFQYVSEISGAQYTPNNKPTAYSDARQYTSVQKMLSAISANVHSGHYRMRANVEGSDTYPVNITRDTVKPGTVYYDPNGHVLLVVRVEQDGTVRMIDGHPDNSLTTQIFGEKFAVGSSAQGGGFRRFRPYTYLNGTFTRVTNDRLTGSKFGLGENQYGKGAGYWEFIRTSLSNGAPVDPVQQMREQTDQLCTDLQDRATAVAGAARVANGPLGTVPPNIYGADGEWEALSTPSRDARFKASVRGIHHLLEQYAPANSEQIRTMGGIWKAATETCNITYKNSAGANVKLTLGQVESRLFDMSFDPYHCPEWRWGAYPTQSSEASTCHSDAAHTKRFDDEKTQRNAIDREYGAPTPFGWGPATAPDVNVTNYLKANGGI